MRANIHRGVLICVVALPLVACNAPDDENDDVFKALGPIELTVDEVSATVWPGNILDDGSRYVRLINGFFGGEPTSYWFIGFASRITSDVFFFCKEGQAECPLHTKTGSINWDAVQGRPVFARVPGQAGFSPFWLLWKVTVSDDYEPNTIKSVEGIQTLAARGELSVQRNIFDHGGEVGPDETLMHCLLVLKGTTLQHNGDDIVNRPGVKAYVVQGRQGWHAQHTVNFFDFTATEGVFPPDVATESRPLMPSSDIFVMFRDCNAGSVMEPCSRTSGELGAISERGAEEDLTGDGDKADTNNVIMAFPRRGAELEGDKVYSPLWRVRPVRVPINEDGVLKLLDETAAQNETDVKSVADIRRYVGEGLLEPPTFMSEEQAGNSIVGNDGKVFFNCPSQVPAEEVPRP